MDRVLVPRVWYANVQWHVSDRVRENLLAQTWKKGPRHERTQG